MKPFQLIKTADVEIFKLDFSSFSLYFSTRQGGVSKPPYNNFNLSFQVGDEREAVVENRKKLVEIVEVPDNNFATLYQMHGSRILKVSQKNTTSFFSGKVVGKADAMITSEPVALALFYADCLPVYLVEPNRKVAGLVHAGWRGLKKEIVKKTVKEMVEEFGISPEGLFAWLGPSIGPCCYQVSSDFISYFKSYPQSIEKTIDGRAFLNLKSIGHAQLLEAGVKEDNIETAPYCTFCRENLFFSHRRENGKTGRQAAILVLRKQ